MDYVIRIPANKNLELEIEDILFRPPAGRAQSPWCATRASGIRPRVGRSPGGLSPRSSITKVSCFLASVSSSRAWPCRAARWCASTTSAARRSSDQGRQAGNELDQAVVSPFPSKRGAATTERVGLQPRQSVAATGTAATDQELVADELAATVDEDRRSAGQACPLLLVLLADGHLNRKLFGDMLRRIWALPCAGRVTPTARTASLAGCRGVGAGRLCQKAPLRSPERYDRADSKVGAAAKGVPNVAVVRNRCIAAVDRLPFSSRTAKKEILAKRLARVACPPSPEKPDSPLPATVCDDSPRMQPSGYGGCGDRQCRGCRPHRKQFPQEN